MLLRVFKPFIILAFLMVLVGTACLNSGPDKTSVPEDPTRRMSLANIPSAPAGKAVNNIDDVQGSSFSDHRHRNHQ